MFVNSVQLKTVFCFYDAVKPERGQGGGGGRKPGGALKKPPEKAAFFTIISILWVFTQSEGLREHLR